VFFFLFVFSFGVWSEDAYCHRKVCNFFNEVDMGNYINSITISSGVMQSGRGKEIGFMGFMEENRN